MKTSIRIVVLTLIGVITLLTVMSVTGRMNRSMEIKSNLSSKAEETVENMSVLKKYSIMDEHEYLADFTENLSGALDTDSDITVQITKADMEKGILSLEVTERFLHPNGREGTVRHEKTIILNKYEEEEEPIFSVKFYYSREVAGNGGTYKICKVKKGDVMPSPAAPVMGEKTFAGWKDMNGNPADFSQGVESDAEYYAEWT